MTENHTPIPIPPGPFDAPRIPFEPAVDDGLRFVAFYAIGEQSLPPSPHDLTRWEPLMLPPDERLLCRLYHANLNGKMLYLHARQRFTTPHTSSPPICRVGPISPHVILVAPTQPALYLFASDLAAKFYRTVKDEQKQQEPEPE